MAEFLLFVKEIVASFFCNVALVVSFPFWLLYWHVYYLLWRYVGFGFRKLRQQEGALEPLITKFERYAFSFEKDYKRGKNKITLRFVYTIPVSRMKHGCCHPYSFAKSVFLRIHYGGDLFCGGGIKHVFPDLFSKVRNYFRFLKIRLKTKKGITVFQVLNSHCDNYFLCGDLKAVDDFSAQNGYHLKADTLVIN